MLRPLYDALQSYSELCLRSYEMLFRRLELERQLLSEMSDEERVESEGLGKTRNVGAHRDAALNEVDDRF
jgi:hypothetical protein